MFLVCQIGFSTAEVSTLQRDDKDRIYCHELKKKSSKVQKFWHKYGFNY